MTENRGGKKGAGLVLGAATVTTGLLAGVWFAYVCSVMPALARSDDRVYVEVMRNINDVIQNPVFFTPFFGVPILTAVAAWQHRAGRARLWTLAGFVLGMAVLVVTSAVNVPLNDALAAAKDPAAARAAFEGPWVAWNIVRAVLSTAGLVCLIGALSVRNRTAD
ncbi:membrane protein [Streptomyces tanashiensis]|uniref:anthrone oxygenase family protein n=1 Tax=Streptomyces tanashiensis TaxID=67367 RepID=UPI0016784E94|nr:anthrone oxygenase family protein [Streptomyces tanashiensis]GGT17741.1 membrane protein [Streptomyces tanashiensis]